MSNQGQPDIFFTRQNTLTTYSTSEFKNGLKVLLNGEPCEMVASEFVKPGKGQAFMRVRLKNLLDGRVIERTFKSGETIPAADVVGIQLQYLYSDDNVWFFMDSSNFEQYSAGEEVMSRCREWVRESDTCSALLHNGRLVSVEPPNFVELKIAHTVPGTKGDTAVGGTKPAELETGVVVKVPLFVSEGEKIRIDTRTGEYVSRAKS